MSTQPISDKASILQELQGFRHHRTTGGFHKARTTEDVAVQSPSVVVVINGSQGTSGPLPPESIHNERQIFFHDRKAALQQLGAALQSGDAAAVQKAYDALVALGKNGPLVNGETFHRADRAQDFAAIGQALASGDLAGAQTAFDALASTFQGHGHSVGTLPPTPAPGPLPPTPAPGPLPPTPVGTLPPTIPPQGTLPPTTLPPSTGGVGGPSGPPEIIINLGGSTSGHVSIDVQQQNGGESVSINVDNGASSYQLVLNLTESAASSSAQSGSVNVQA
ncbi:MAG: hypothetical protein HY010_03095 [Acidobacteria bacterium]|nr:hypothetical protein [Acidobacteriota bacterium]